MSLNSLIFIIYFAVLLVPLAILQQLKKRKEELDRIQLLLLLLFSYFFIIKTDWRFCLCVIGVTAISYLFALMIDERKSSKFWLIFGCIALILILGYFKYANFFLNSLFSAFGYDTVALSIILPIGISFYVFSAIAYLIDVYRGEYRAERNILNYSLYITFFPKVISGPIVRGKDFFPQVKCYKGIQWETFKTGIQIFVFGLFKKIP